MICHETPNLSWSQPNFLLKGYSASSIIAEPSLMSAFQYFSTSSLVLQATTNEMDGLNLNRGPALRSMNFWLKSSIVTMSIVPEGVLWRVVVFLIVPSLKVDM